MLGMSLVASSYQAVVGGSCDGDGDVVVRKVVVLKIHVNPLKLKTIVGVNAAAVEGRS